VAIRKQITPLCLLTSVLCCYASTSSARDGLAPEVTDLNAKDVSMQWEKSIPYLEEAYINLQPTDLKDGIPIGVLGADGGNKDLILAFAREVAADKDKNRKDKTDSLLISHKGKLILESYYRRGRQNLPHFQMSITKAYTAFALGRAMQLGYLTMEDLNKPVVDFLENLDRSRLVKGADKVTLAEALTMRSGVRLIKEKMQKYKDHLELLDGQKQIEAYFEASEPIPPAPREFRYQAADPAMIMQVLEAAVPGSAEDFIRKELMYEYESNVESWDGPVAWLRVVCSCDGRG